MDVWEVITVTIEARYHDAIKRIGGAPGLLALPRQIQECLKNTKDLNTKTKMLEAIAERAKK